MKNTKVLAVDLDEVVFSYADGLREVMRLEGVTVPDEQPEFYSLARSGWFDTMEDFIDFHAMAVEKYRLYTRLETLPGASKSLWKLADQDYQINIITSRFVKPGQHRMVVSQTVEALDAHHIPYNNLSFMSNKVLQYADAYIDDSPSNCEGLHAAGRTVLKRVMRYNADSPGIPVNSWDETLAEIDKLFKVS